MQMNIRFRRAVSALLILVLLSTLLTAFAADKKQYGCGKEEHRHGEACYAAERVCVCGLEEGEAHQHGSSCYTRRTKLACTLVEGEGHTHGANCYTSAKKLTCTLPEDEDHAHAEGCYTGEEKLVCSLAESEPHRHSRSCYAEDVVYICGMDGTPGHVHTNDCLSPESLILVCTLGNDPHAHTESCYKEERVLKCTLPEHTHTEACLVQPKTETPAEWEASTLPAELNGNWNHDLLAVARTQLGYAPDGTNMLYDASGNPLGYYTRYGDWYSRDTAGLLYGDWCMMFVSFCLYYAGIDGLPYGANCESWLKSLDSFYFHPYGDAYKPKGGDIVLFTYGRTAFRQANEARQAYGMEPLPSSDIDLSASHVGIVVAATGSTLCTIEGNNGPVSYHYYQLGADETILGFVSLPPNPHSRTITDFSMQCDVTGDFPAYGRPYLREPTYFELVRWGKEYKRNSLILAWGVNFVHGQRDYIPTGELHYLFRFDALPENVKVTCLQDDIITEIPCTVEGNTVSFDTECVGTFFFARG